jgi:hypothetical protein
MNSKITILILKTILLFALFNCSSKTDSVTGEKVLIEPNPQTKAKQFADKGGGIFGDINNKKSSESTVNFATSNVLWRATLKSLDFLPLANADYSGGVIVYDWYSDKLSNEQIKVTINFLSNELRSDSIQIISYKKTCDENNKCITEKLNNDLSKDIKEKIIITARAMKIEESKSNLKN